MKRGPEKQFCPTEALQKAMEVFLARGYQGASLSELLDQMGIGRKSLYDTFGNKHELFLKTLELYSQTAIKEMQDQLAAPGSPKANIEAVLLKWQDANSQPDSKGCLIGNNLADFCTEDAGMAHVLSEHLTQLENAFTDAVARAQAAGEFPADIPPGDLARLLVCLGQGVALMGRVTTDQAHFKGVFEAILTLLRPA